MSFANQFLAMLHMAEHGRGLAKTVHDLSPEQDQRLALLKLGTMGIAIDELTEEQKVYATDYSAGT